MHAINLEEILKQITPDSTESFEAAPGGEFARFRRDFKIPYTNQDKDLLNIEKRDSDDKKFSIVKLPDSAASYQPEEKTHNLADRLKAIDPSIQSNQLSANKQNNLTNFTQHEARDRVNKTGIRSEIIGFPEQKVSPQKKIHEGNMNLQSGVIKAIEIGTNTSNPNRRHHVPTDGSGSGSGSGATEFPEIKSSSESGFSEESGSNLDSDSGSNAESGSDSEGTEIVQIVKKSSVPHKTLIQQEIGDGLTLNEAAFLSNLENPESGSGANVSDSKGTESESGDSEHPVLERSDILHSSGSGKSEELESGSGASEPKPITALPFHLHKTENITGMDGISSNYSKLNQTTKPEGNFVKKPKISMISTVIKPELADVEKVTAEKNFALPQPNNSIPTQENVGSGNFSADGSTDDTTNLMEQVGGNENNRGSDNLEFVSSDVVKGSDVLESVANAYDTKQNENNIVVSNERNETLSNAIPSQESNQTIVNGMVGSQQNKSLSYSTIGDKESNEPGINMMMNSDVISDSSLRNENTTTTTTASSENNTTEIKKINDTAYAQPAVNIVKINDTSTLPITQFTINTRLINPTSKTNNAETSKEAVHNTQPKSDSTKTIKKNTLQTRKKQESKEKENEATISNFNNENDSGVKVNQSGGSEESEVAEDDGSDLFPSTNKISATDAEFIKAFSDDDDMPGSHGDGVTESDLQEATKKTVKENQQKVIVR